MQDKIDQIDAREAELIKNFDIQSEKFGGIFLVDEFIGVDVLFVYLGDADHPLRCSR